MKTEELLNIIDENLDKLPEILAHISIRLSEYQELCKNRNDKLLRDALGSACQILAMKKKPSEKEMPHYCVLIEQAQFPNGLESWHHQGEISFYNRYLKETKNENRSSE